MERGWSGASSPAARGGAEDSGQSLVARIHEIKSFLSRSRIPFRWLDTEQDQNARNTLEQPGDANHAVVLLPDGSRLIDPDVRELAARLGLDTPPYNRFYDLIVMEGGPPTSSTSSRSRGGTRGPGGLTQWDLLAHP